MYNLIHLHTDPKFFHGTLPYESIDFKNIIIFLGEIKYNEYERLNALKVQYEVYPKTKKSIKDISEKYKYFDGAVIYDLCDYKQNFLGQFPKSFKFFWLFFGYEIYSQLPHYYVSKKTLRTAFPISLTNHSIKDFILRWISRFRNKEFYLDKRHLEKIYHKIDAILIFSKHEYLELSNLVTLPKFIKRNLNRIESFEPRQKEMKIIIGNSKWYWNNHLDVLQIINSVQNKFVCYELFFNYGPNSIYTKKVFEIIENQNKFNLIEDFLGKKEFENVYETASALIINSYRQHALGNIFTAIFNGCKLYLSSKSSTYKWFKEEGFYVSEVESLKNDLKNNDISLSENEQYYNYYKYCEVRDSYTGRDFIENIKQILKS